MNSLLTHVEETILLRTVKEQNEAPSKYNNSPLIVSRIFLSISPSSIQNGASDA